MEAEVKLSDRLDAWLGALDHSAPDLARRVRRGFVTAPLRGSVGLPNHVRRAAGPGWALVGDAGFHRDPITGHGMTDAFRDAELLADAADAMLRRAVPEDVAMAGYERQRDEALQRRARERVDADVMVERTFTRRRARPREV